MDTRGKLQSILSSSSAWDATAAQYSAAMAKINFTVGYAKDAWDAVYDKAKISVRVLDIACGTGALSLPAAEAVKETGGSVLATDFSPKMIDCVTEALKTLNLPNVETRVEDGQDLHIPDAQFDYAFSIFGLIFFPDSQKGLREACRVLKQGGKIAVTSWTPKNTFLAVASEIMKRHNRPNFVFSFLDLGNKEIFANRLTEAGFTDVKVVEVLYDMPIDDYQRFINNFNTNPAYVGVREELGMDNASYEKEIIEIMKELYPILPTKVPNVALLGTGTKV